MTYRIIPKTPYSGLQHGVYIEENHMGYRYDSARDLNGAVWFLGCSYVYGEGLEVEETCADLVERATGRTVINLGRMGASPEFVCSLLEMLLAQDLKPSHVVIAWPNVNRYWYRHDPEFLGPWMFDTHPIYADAAQANLIAEVSHARINQTLAELRYRAIPVVEFRYDTPWHHWRTAREIPSFDRVDLARDGIHPGTETNRTAALWVTSQLKD